MKAQEDKTEKKKKLTYDMIAEPRSGYVTALKTLNTCRLIPREVRKEIRGIIAVLQDKVHGVRAKLSQLQEDYQEMKNHKTVVDDKDKFKALLLEFNLDVIEIKESLGDYHYEGGLVEVSKFLEILPTDSKELIVEKNTFYPFFTEMEDLFLA